MLKKNKIYIGDCLELFPQIPDGSVDLVVIDPPYNLGKDFGNESDVWGDVQSWLDWSKKWLNESERVLKDSGSIFVYGIHHYICYIQCYLYETGMHYGRQFIWHYENGWSKYTRSPAATYEPILWFYKTKKYYYKEMREPYKSKERLKYKITKNGKTWQPNPNGKISGDVWKVPTLAGRRFADEKVAHPTQKPLQLCEKITKYFCPENGLILVPFAGSGSECVSAALNGRSYIGFELNKKYVSIAEERLKTKKKQQEQEKELLLIGDV
ncbi:MAG: site-specific DNA-methyltransferase [Candidatus Omnitrophica bacterium]|nr:site-specific DNA-methyltransferase [Candidatus Omnitrophota bacterium]